MHADHSESHHSVALASFEKVMETKASTSTGSTNLDLYVVGSRRKREVMTDGEALASCEESSSHNPVSANAKRQKQSCSETGFPKPCVRQSDMSIMPDAFHLLCELEEEIDQDPVEIVVRTLDILAASSSDVAVRLYCYQTLKTITPLVLLRSFALQRQEEDYENYAVDELLRAMNRHMENPLVATEAGKVMQRLLSEKYGALNHSSEREERPYFEKGVQILCQLIEKHISEPRLICLIFDLVRRFKSPTSSQEHWLVGVSSMMQAMEAYPDIAYIQQIGLSILAWLAEDSNCREVVLRDSGVQIIPEVMRFHTEDSLIQCNAIAALCWLVHASRCRLDPGDIPTVLEVMRIHEDNPSAFGNCVCLLCGMDLNSVDIRSLTQCILTGMNRHLKSAKVQEGCLRWLQFRDPNNFQDEFKAAVPTVLDAMRLHMDDAHLQSQAVEALVMFAGTELLRDALLEVGAVDVVLAMLKRHKTDARVQQGTAWFLSLCTPATASTIAFGGGVGVMEVIWQSLGVGNTPEVESQEG